MITIFGGEDAKAPTSLVGKAGNLKETPGSKEVTPVMKQALEEKNDQRIEEAQRQGISAIPTPIDPPKTLLEITSEDSQSEDPLLRWQQMQTERARSQREQQVAQEGQKTVDPQRENRLTSLMQAMVFQMESIMGKNQESKIQNMKVFDPETLRVNNGELAGENAGGTSIGGLQSVATPTKPENVIIAAGRIEYAQMILEANSDIPGPVVALMASGKFSGAKLLGKFTSQEEYLVITFNTLITKKGTSIPINAYAIDPGTSLTGIATDVDHRYLKRIILPAAAKFVEGLGDAYAETTTETTQNATTTSTPSKDLNTKQEFGKAVADMASKIGEVLDEDGKETKPLVIVAAGTPLGILFMDSITDKEVLTARAGGSSINSGRQLNQGQQVQYQGQQPIGALNPLQQLQSGFQNQQFFQQNDPNMLQQNTPNNSQNLGQ